MTLQIFNPSPDDPNHILSRYSLPAIPENTPQKIKAEYDKDGYITLYKQDVIVIRFHKEDFPVQQTAEVLFTRAIIAGLIVGEMEQIRDMINDLIRENKQ